MSYSVFKSFWELLAPQPVKRTNIEKITNQHKDYDEIIAKNEAGETIVMHLPKKYSLSYR